MNRENYYLSAYQAVLDKDTTKKVWLDYLRDEEMDNYRNDTPTLNYNEVFKNNDPNKFIISIILSENYRDFLMAYENALEPMANKENIATREFNHLNLMKHPLINYCPHPTYVVESILSISYSTLIDKKTMYVNLKEAINKSFIIKDVLSTIAIYSTIEFAAPLHPLTISLVGAKMTKHDPTFESDNLVAVYTDLNNRVVVTNTGAELNLSSTIHELAHKAIYEIFLNNIRPYNDESSRTKYHTSIKNTLLNIQRFIKQDFDLDIKLDNQDDTMQMGKALSRVLIPNSLKGEDIQELILSLKQHNLSLDAQFSWLGGQSLLEYAMPYTDLELATALVDAGAVIKPTLIHYVLKYQNAFNVFNWILDNKRDLDINHKDENGKTALDFLAYERDPQLYKILILAGANPYSLHESDYICDLDPTPQNAKQNTKTQEKQLDAINAFLQIYVPYYNDKGQEDIEFIVRLPQIIAINLYEDKIIEILEPLAEYWQEVISPAVQNYQDKFDSSALYYDNFFSMA